MISRRVIAWLCVAAMATTTIAAQPNVVIFFSDDHSQRDSSVYGDPGMPMPNLAQLAADGMKLTGAFCASPSCAPSRAAMLTGLMPARNGAIVNHSLPRPGTHNLIQDFHSAGYEVAVFGKVSHAREQGPWDYDVYFPNSELPGLRVNVRKYLEHRTDSRPLCLLVGTSNPHVPWSAQPSFDPQQISLPPILIDTPDTRVHRARYMEEIKRLDQFLGELRDLTRERLGEDTAMVYVSDHGAQWPFGKWTMYDYGTRVPLVIDWPGTTQSGTESAALVSLVDLLPTVLDLCGGQVPAGIDGRSFAGLLRGEAEQHREEVFITHTADGNVNAYPCRAVRTEKWKLIHNLHCDWAFTNHSDLHRRQWAGRYWTEWAAASIDDPAAAAIVERYFRHPEFELYDLDADPWEQRNLAADPAHTETLAALRANLDAWRAQQGDTAEPPLRPRRLDVPQTWDPHRWDPQSVPIE